MVERLHSFPLDKVEICQETGVEPNFCGCQGLGRFGGMISLDRQDISCRLLTWGVGSR